ncbi:MAG: restriction endonuclease [Bacteroidales bacterium]
MAEIRILIEQILLDALWEMDSVDFKQFRPTGYPKIIRTVLSYISIYHNQDIIEKDSISTVILSASRKLVKLDMSNYQVLTFNHLDPTLYKILNKNPKLLNNLDWRVFEVLLADILSYYGYEIELTKKTHDGGVDIVAFKDKNILGGHKYIIQAKKTKNSIGVDPVRNLLFLRSHYKASKACLATTSTFTKGAWELESQYKWQLQLRDYLGIQEWISGIIKMI